VDAFVEEARKTGSQAPSKIGFGMTSDPIRECSLESLMIAVEQTLRQPCKLIGVDEKSCEIKDCEGYMERKMTLNATGKQVVERIRVHSDTGEVSNNKLGADGQPGRAERMLAIHTNPLRLEFYQRYAESGMRLDWEAPWDVTREMCEKLVQLARRVQNDTHAIVGFGLTSEPLDDASEDAVWKAMLVTVHNPSTSGLRVDNVMFSRFAKNGTRVPWKAPRSIVKDIFRVVKDLAETMTKDPPTFDAAYGATSVEAQMPTKGVTTNNGKKANLGISGLSFFCSSV